MNLPAKDRMTGGTRRQRSPSGSPGGRPGRGRSVLPGSPLPPSPALEHLNFQIGTWPGGALEAPSHCGAWLGWEETPGASVRGLPGLLGPGRARAVVLAGAGRTLPMGRLRGLVAGRRLPLSAQRAGALSPGRRGRSRAAGWRGRTPGSAGCGTRRGSAAPASGPRPWAAPWDAETPCCAAGRAGPGSGSGRPPKGEREPGRGERAPRVVDGVGGLPGAGGGDRAWKGADPGSRERGTSEGAVGVRRAARLVEQERGRERSRTSDRHRQTRN